ncbi:hypothetical protein SAMN05421767_1103 [Granulicatella balaenopterae]|uniref:ABC-2 family transporter protein n=1 Tax=Granulicatella balaenopterae TaxID=137733 RepID=A0A1H9JQX2_9LACT|nr:hypothetical protein [Granulicatella balaenopterae]SEQ89153.1 hypothetical protein SAMN05421767_1103 [Granulicatella balaenopterae]
MKLLKIELLKQKKFLFILCVLFPLLLNILLYIDLTYRYESYLLVHQSRLGLSNWQLIFKEQTVFNFSELCQLIIATVVYEVFSVELKNNGWSLVSTSNYRNKVVYGKYLIAMLAMLVFFLTDYACLVIIGNVIGVSGNIEWVMIIKSFIIQLLSASMMVAAYILIVSLVKRVMFLLPIGIIVMIQNASLYYPDQQFLLQYPFTYISHGFRATGNEFLISIAILSILTALFLLLSKRILERNRDIRQ